MKAVSKTIEKERKKLKGGFLGMLILTLGASLLGNILTGKGIVRGGYGNKEEKGISKAGYGSPDHLFPTPSFNKLWNTKVLSEWI